jgi:DNA-binding MarR family transcriptional regulator
MEGLDMDAIASGVSNQDYASPAPILLIGENDRAVERARRTVGMSNMRLAEVASLRDGPERIRQQARASALWIEIECDGGADLDRLLEEASREADNGRCPVVVAAPLALLDPVSAQVSDSVQLVVDGSPSDRAAALALALAAAEAPVRVSDVVSDGNTARLRQLSDEVSRIAATLARLSSDPAAGGAEIQKPAEGEIPDVPVDTVRSVIRARRLRSRYFSEELFADPAWDMLLDLLQAEIAQLRVPVSSLCIAAAVPATTALRWLKNMVDHGLFVRRADPHDARRVFVELAPQASLALRRYFADVGKPAVI